MNKGICKSCGKKYDLRHPHRHSRDIDTGKCADCNREAVKP